MHQCLPDLQNAIHLKAVQYMYFCIAHGIVQNHHCRANTGETAAAHTLLWHKGIMCLNWRCTTLQLHCKLLLNHCKFLETKHEKEAKNSAASENEFTCARVYYGTYASYHRKTVMKRKTELRNGEIKAVHSTKTNCFQHISNLADFKIWCQ